MRRTGSGDAWPLAGEAFAEMTCYNFMCQVDWNIRGWIAVTA
jgi:hypothetical protein